ncbi:glycogen debranching enzyme N-terminal domain-containing protein [Capnocytophaga canimorsus]|uniref:glycogen debranching enzyme N-terminal domain-containing protein n=1 Tax=Capnocytophaga canimorsus TaxID=28188 RepID=UPI0037D139BB
MSYLTFKKKELINLEYSLDREFLGTNRGGGYSSSTLVFCNTRKYHGLLVVPLENFRGQNHVLLSSLDETIIQHGRDFNFAVHQYPETYEPRGHKYIVDVSYEKAFTVIYQVGGVTLKKEILMVHNEPQVLVRYTLLEAHSPTKLRLNPLLAFRDIHSLSKVNDLANKNIEKIEGGIKTKLYPDFPYLHLQLSQDTDFEYQPNWNCNIFYKKEKERGYDYTEDLLTLGYFELNIKKGESVVFSASTEENNSKQLKQKFTRLINQRRERNSFEECLNYSATQFLIQKAGEIRVKEGYHWYNSNTRDTFIALPGIALAENTQKTFDEVLTSVKKYFSNGLFEKTVSTHVAERQYDADTSLWFFWTIQQYEKYTKKTPKQLWKEFGEVMRTILETYKNGRHKSIRMDNNGLIWSEDISRPLTWVDAQFDGGAIVPRNGYVVEVNALWYNAVCYALALAEASKDKDFLKEWSDLPTMIAENFNQTFWIADKKYLADYVNYAHQNRDVRPNQLITCALAYSPLDERSKKRVLDIVRQELLTPRGLRSLSPKNKSYESVSIGNVYDRDRATFNGSVHPWFIGFYIEAHLKIYGKTYIPDAEAILADFEEELSGHGVSTISAIYDGNPPFRSRGCISKARNVAEILRAKQLTMSYEL